MSEPCEERRKIYHLVLFKDFLGWNNCCQKLLFAHPFKLLDGMCIRESEARGAASLKCAHNAANAESLSDVCAKSSYISSL